MITIRTIWKKTQNNTFGTDVSSEVSIVNKEALPLMLRGCSRFAWISGDAALYWALVSAFMFGSSWFLSLGSTIIDAVAVLSCFFVVALASFVIIAIFRKRFTSPFGLSIMGEQKTSQLAIVILGLSLSVLIFIQYAQNHPAYILPLSLAVFVSILFMYAYHSNGDINLSHIYGVFLLFSIASINFKWFEPDSLFRLLLFICIFIFGIYGLRRIKQSALRSSSKKVFELFPRKFFSSPHPSDRLLTAIFLSNYLEAKFLPQLLNLSKDENAHVARAAQLALARIWGPNRVEQEEFFNKLERRFVNYRDDEDSIYIKHEVERIKSQTIKEMRQHVREVSYVAETILQNNTGLIKQIFDLLALTESREEQKSNNEALKISLFKLLAQSNEHTAYAKLSQVIAHSDKQTAQSLLDALLASKNYKAQVHIIPLITHSKTWLALLAQETLQDYLATEAKTEEFEHDKKIVMWLAKEQIEKALCDQRSSVRAYAQWFLVHEDQAYAKEKLQDAIHSNNWMVQAEAIGALSALSKEDAMIEACHYLSSSHDYLRYKSLETLHFLKVKGLKSVAHQLSQDKNLHIRLLAQAILYL